jgi:hypothetical protein
MSAARRSNRRAAFLNQLLIDDLLVRLPKTLDRTAGLDQSKI